MIAQGHSLTTNLIHQLDFLDSSVHIEKDITRKEIAAVKDKGRNYLFFISSSNIRNQLGFLWKILHVGMHIIGMENTNICIVHTIFSCFLLV